MNSLEVKVAKLEQKVDDVKEDQQDIKSGIGRIEKRLENTITNIQAQLNNKADKDLFVFWRNLLVSGILLAIALGIITLCLEKYFRG
jgi:tetrahydromethanopterin S-methyltransferase subunit G